MIKRDRTVVPEPAALKKVYSSRSKPPKLPGKTELESVLQAFQAHVNSGGDPTTFQFPFERYKEKDVRRALTLLFNGKCAYCESNYSGTQPMDVEHWRPKGKVEDDPTHPGYYWLASEWSNLLPSCIDCNRARTQFDAVEEKEVTLGKANQFPISGARLTSPNGNDTDEKPLILNPCEDDPSAYFLYTEEGYVLPLSDSGVGRNRAMMSIQVYALNRSDLVSGRLAVRRLVDHRFNLIDEMRKIRDQLDSPDDAPIRDAVEELISIEADALLAMKADDQPYAGMVQAMLEEADPL